MNDIESASLAYHQSPSRPGKISIEASKPLATQHDLALAYSPGVAGPVRKIAADPATAYDYTNKGNLVAVVSNGTAVLGLGNQGALASKPVMEGKAVLFKKFAQVDAIDIELNTEDPEEFIRTVELIAPSFGGINLEDIKAPECFTIEQELIKRLPIPVFHDDQHGTAIVAGAGLLNALELVNKKIDQVRLVLNGAGSAGIAMCRFFLELGIRKENLILCDSRGVVYKGRTEGMNRYKEEFAIDRSVMVSPRARRGANHDTTDTAILRPASALASAGRRAQDDSTIPLADALVGADIFMGISVADVVTPDMINTMSERPIVFAMANPDPEIRPEAVKKVRPDTIVATGRSDYPNQVNNVLGFPYIFRGALDARARDITMEMKIAAATALASLARKDVPKEVLEAYGKDRLEFGPDYIIPTPFDPRLIEVVAPAVALAANK